MTVNNTVAVFYVRSDKMQVELYKTTDSPNVINKTLTKVREVNITFRQMVDENAPVMILHNQNIDGCNYAYIPTFKRYYFISDISNYNNVLSRVALTSDLLMTYQDTILNTEVLVTATEHPSYSSNSLPTTRKIISDKYTSNVTLPKGTTKVLTTIGG